MITLNMESSKEVVMNWIAIAVEFVKSFLADAIICIAASVWLIGFFKAAIVLGYWLGIVTFGLATSIAFNQLVTFTVPLALLIYLIILLFRAVG